MHKFRMPDQKAGCQSVGGTGDAQIDQFERPEQSVLQPEVLVRPSGAVVLHVREAAGSEDVVVDAARAPVEVRQAALVAGHVAVPDEVGRPLRLATLQEVRRQNFRRARLQTQPKLPSDQLSESEHRGIAETVQLR